MDVGNLLNIFDGFVDLWDRPEILGMLAIALVLIYLGIAKGMEPLLLIPIGIGVILANLPLGEAVI